MGEKSTSTLEPAKLVGLPCRGRRRQPLESVASYASWASSAESSAPARNILPDMLGPRSQSTSRAQHPRRAAARRAGRTPGEGRWGGGTDPPPTLWWKPAGCGGDACRANFGPRANWHSSRARLGRTYRSTIPPRASRACSREKPRHRWASSTAELAAGDRPGRLQEPSGAASPSRYARFERSPRSPRCAHR